MNKPCSIILATTLSITTVCFSFICDDVFKNAKIWSTDYLDLNTTINKLIFFFIVCAIVALGVCIWRWLRKKIILALNKHKVQVEYEDIFEIDECKKIINFDECYSTEIGDDPHQIKPTSVCGQFLIKFPHIDITGLISRYGIKHQKKASKYNMQPCFKSGTLVPYNDEYLLMAFGKLNKDGRAVMCREEYVESLMYLWEQVDKFFAQTDVAIPILGSGITRFKGEELSQQELLDIMIMTYRLSAYKIKHPHKLRIICKKQDDFSINKITAI